MAGPSQGPRQSDHAALAVESWTHETDRDRPQYLQTKEGPRHHVFFIAEFGHVQSIPTSVFS